MARLFHGVRLGYEAHWTPLIRTTSTLLGSAIRTADVRSWAEAEGSLVL